ncbi:hypothetical protein L195_g029703, partial [Trifolium pratense]
SFARRERAGNICSSSESGRERLDRGDGAKSSSHAQHEPEYKLEYEPQPVDQIEAEYDDKLPPLPQLARNPRNTLSRNPPPTPTVEVFGGGPYVYPFPSLSLFLTHFFLSKANLNILQVCYCCNCYMEDHYPLRMESC